MMGIWPEVLGGALLGVLGTAMAVALIYSFAATGPGCPGEDPSWIGWCSDARNYGGLHGGLQ